MRAAPGIRWRIADAELALDAIAPQLSSLASDVDSRVDHGAAWFRYLTGAKHRSTETARYVADQAMRVAGGSGYRAALELARLQRDVLAGIYHPSDTETVYATVATNLLGADRIASLLEYAARNETETDVWFIVRPARGRLHICDGGCQRQALCLREHRVRIARRQFPRCCRQRR